MVSDPYANFLMLERFGDVVDAACLESFDHLLRLVARGDKDN